ncbi:MAG: phytoene desaturase family protein [Syntrophales bacterium]
MYDTIVIGNDLSSLVAAAMVSHHGRQTVLVSEGDARHVYTDYGYTFNIDPAPLSGFGPAQTCSRLLANLGMPVTELSGLQLLNPGLQIILSDHRIDCFNGLEELLHDMEREFSGEKDEIRKLYASVLKISNIVEQTITEKPFICPTNFAEFISALTRMPLILKEKLLLSRRFKAISNNPSLARVFETKSAVLSNWCYKESGPVSVASAYALSSPLKGLYHHIAGNEVLPGLLKTAFESSGGHLIKDCTVMRIDINEKIDVDVSIPDKLSQISGQYLIASTKWEKLRLLLLSDRKFRRMERRLKLARSAYYPFTLHMGILERCVPEKTAIYVAIVIDENRPVMDDNLVFVEISAKDCEDRAPAGKRALSATIFLKESPLVLTNDELKEVSQVVFCALEKFFPFLRENLDFLDIGMSIELSRKSQELVNHKYAMQSGSFFGMSGISNKTPHRNVFMTGGMLLAGLGFQGEIISGINAANLVISKEREKDG